jgi:hypothetical protein
MIDNKLNNIIDRAKKINSKEYVIGKMINHEGKSFIIESIEAVSINEQIDAVTYSDVIYGTIYEVDISTRALHLPKMLDSKNNKMFASIRKDGKGGDICENIQSKKTTTLKYIGKYIGEEDFRDGVGYYGFNLDLCSGYPPEEHSYKIIGIQE